MRSCRIVARVVEPACDSQIQIDAAENLAWHFFALSDNHMGKRIVAAGNQFPLRFFEYLSLASGASLHAPAC